MADLEKLHCENEYDVLRKVVVCSPKYMEIGEIINETQKRYKDENIDVEVAIEQHNDFVRVLRKNDVEVIELPPQPKLNEQVFTRDIGFAIDEHLFLASMGSDIRKDEIKIVDDVLKSKGYQYTDLVVNSIEGGDVIVDHKKVLVGLTNRTTKKAAEELQERLPNHEIITVPLIERVLHLDCAFNIVGPNTAIAFPGAFTGEELSILENHYDVIEISKDEEFRLATNVLNVGNKKIISMPQNERVNAELEKRGFQIIEVDFSEIIKSGGSFRCCSFPLLRSN